MDWGLFESLLRCEPGGSVRTIFAIIGAAAGPVSVLAGAYQAFRWWRRPPQPPADKRFARALRQEGRRLAGIRDFDCAIGLYTAALALQPRGAEIYFLRGVAHESKGDIISAIVDWEAALRIHPAHRQARTALMRHSADRKQPAQPVNDGRTLH